MEIVKYFVGMLINSDMDMYHEESNTPAAARTSSLVEELGQVDYVFSDKTGTLTCNVMEFKMVSIAGVAYAEVVPDEKKPRIDENGKQVVIILILTYKGWYDFERLKSFETSHPTGHIIQEFLQLLSVCHTVIPEESEEEPGKIIFQASSPDEAALVKGAQSLGYIFTTRRPRSVSILHNGIAQEWEILNICEFNSTRKRMSAVVRDPQGKIKLYIKGADTVILERLKPDNPYIDATLVHLEVYI